MCLNFWPTNFTKRVGIVGKILTQNITNILDLPETKKSFIAVIYANFCEHDNAKNTTNGSQIEKLPDIQNIT